MGTPSNVNKVDVVDFVTGDAKVPDKEISADEGGRILCRAIYAVNHCFKYVAGFKSLKELLNGKLFDWERQFCTPDEAMPSLEGTDLNEKTRFVAMASWETPKNKAEPGHEINWGVLLLTDNGHFVILKLSFFKQSDRYVVCGSSLIAHGIEGGHKCVLTGESAEIRNLLAKGQVYLRSLLDHLYLLFYHTISEREKRLEAMRSARDKLKVMYDKIG